MRSLRAQTRQRAVVNSSKRSGAVWGNVRYVPFMSTLVSDFLRNQQARIALRWEEEVHADLPAQSTMQPPVLLDHLSDFLDGLADWIDGRTEQAERAFSRLAEGHAL